MIVIIDAYNLFKQVFKKPHLSEGEIKHLLKKLAAYSAAKKLNLVVVFDGGTFPFVSQERSGNMKIMHSGYRQSADHVIKNLLQEAKGETILVSSDLELRNAAKAVNIESFSSLDFYGKMEETTGAKKSQRVNTAEDSRFFKLSKDGDSGANFELDALMTLYSQKIPTKNDEEDSSKHASKYSNDNRESKKEKRISKILKKL